MGSKLLLVRPGSTLYDEQNRVQGVLDIPLSERGKAEVARLAETLSAELNDNPLSALYYGPGESVIRTADTLGKAMGLRPRKVDELRNLDQGLWQGLQIEEIKRRNTRLFRQWIDDPLTICPPEGETIEVAMDRIRSALRPLLRRHQEEQFGLIAGEPLARLVACFVKGISRPQLDLQLPCCGREWIEVPAELALNGFS